MKRHEFTLIIGLIDKFNHMRSSCQLMWLYCSPLDQHNLLMFILITRYLSCLTDNAVDCQTIHCLVKAIFINESIVKTQGNCYWSTSTPDSIRLMRNTRQYRQCGVDMSQVPQGQQWKQQPVVVVISEYIKMVCGVNLRIEH